MDKNKHLISKYLEGQLDPLSAARFEEDLKNDPLLRSEMELYREVDEALADTEMLNFRSQLKDLHEGLVTEIDRISIKSSKRLVRVAAAAGILLVVALGTGILLTQGMGNQRLLNKFYEPYTMTMVNRSGDADINILMNKALMHYENKEYKEAVVLFERLLDKDPSQMATRLYSGISYFEIREYQKASNSFARIIEHNDNLYVEQAEWYMGFCMIMRDEKEKAIKQFEKIVKDGGFYSEKASQILKKLK